MKTRGAALARRAALALLAGLVAAGAARAQEPDAPSLADVWRASEAAEAILTSADGVGLEAFEGSIATGVYLHGTLGGKAESVAWGADPQGKRYLWFSIGTADSVEHVAMLFDTDRDLTPEFLLFRTIDWIDREETIREYRTAGSLDVPIDIQVQPACRPPACDPATWTTGERAVVEVPVEFFHPWRAAWGVAAIRGEPWIGKPKAALLPGVAEAEPSGPS